MTFLKAPQVFGVKSLRFHTLAHPLNGARNNYNHVRISSVDRALDCRAGGRGFDSRGRRSTQGLKITEKLGTSLALGSNG